MILQHVSLEDIHIYDIDIKYGVTGYNIADLLNIPYYWAGWKQNPHCGDENYYNIAKNTAMNNIDTILGKYYLSRIDDDEKIPNLPRLNDVVDKYIEEKKIKDKDIYNFINDDNILFVHVRSGDYGIVSENYINNIYNLSLKFSKVILLSGINRNIDHTDENSSNNIAKRNNLVISLNNILKKNNNIYVYLAEPDLHIVAMRLCKNLLVHRGGYSVMGTLICTGKIYYTNELPCINNEYWLNIIKDKNIIKI